MKRWPKPGQASAAVYFNLGNAWFKAGQFGRAICAWRRAQELAPRDPDVRANLQFARSQAGQGAPALPGLPLARWTTRLTINEWTVLSSLAVAFFFLLLTARQIWPALKKSTNGLAWRWRRRLFAAWFVWVWRWTPVSGRNPPWSLSRNRSCASAPTTRPRPCLLSMTARNCW